MSYFPKIDDILQSRITLGSDVETTPLQHNTLLSEHYGANIYLKREDLQEVRSYKIRGALNKIKSLSKEETDKGVVCASAGNHAQGVAQSCFKLKIKGTIYMPTTTPKQKIDQVRMFGKEYVDIVLVGDTFDAANSEALKFCESAEKVFVHPFDDPKIIEGQGTIGIEIAQEMSVPADYIFIPIGGGGLISGVGACLKQISPKTKIIGAEPSGAQSMKAAFDKGKVVTLDQIEKFVDGAAVKRVGDYNFEIAKQVIDDLIAVPEGAICTTILDLYNRNAIVVEPAGALSVTALEFYKDKIKGKNVVCIVSGSNNDITRMEEIRERSLLYEGLKHYFIIRFPQRPGALNDFVTKVVGDGVDITHFSYSQKNHKGSGPALLGLELKSKADYAPFINRMKKNKIAYEYLNENPDLFNFLI